MVQLMIYFPLLNGLKKDDPLSSSPSILGAEVLIGSLNNLINDRRFILCTMTPKFSDINHLAYAYDIIIFSSDKSSSMKRVINQIRKYVNYFDQMVNRN